MPGFKGRPLGQMVEPKLGQIFIGIEDLKSSVTEN
jgi:hypothetical protein